MYEWVTFSEKDVDVLFDWESEDLQIRDFSTEYVYNKFEDKLGHNTENVSDLRSEAVLKLIVLCGIFTEEESLSFLFCRIGMIGFSDDRSEEFSEIP